VSLSTLRFFAKENYTQGKKFVYGSPHIMISAYLLEYKQECEGVRARGLFLG
jgi:hypothetical protein